MTKGEQGLCGIKKGEASGGKKGVGGSMGCPDRAGKKEKKS